MRVQPMLACLAVLLASPLAAQSPEALSMLDRDPAPRVDLAGRGAPAPRVLVEPQDDSPRRNLKLETVGFYARRDRGRGDFHDRSRIGRFSESARVGMVLRSLLPVGFRVESLGGGREVVSSSRGALCPSLLYLDGARLTGTVVLDELALTAQDVEAMEFYNSAGVIPQEFAGTGARCGVVVVWTRASS